MERRLQIEVHGLLWTAAIHTEADLYHRWVAARFLSTASRDAAKINLIFALFDRSAAKWRDRDNHLFVSRIAYAGLFVPVLLAANFVILTSASNIESILLKSRLLALCIAAILLSDAFYKWNTCETVRGEIPSLIEGSPKIDYLVSISQTL